MTIRNVGKGVVSSAIWTGTRVNLQGRKGDLPRSWAYSPKKARSVRVCRSVPKNLMNERLALGMMAAALHEAYTQGWKYSSLVMGA